MRERRTGIQEEGMGEMMKRWIRKGGKENEKYGKSKRGDKNKR